MKDEHVEAAFSILNDELERVLIETNRDAKQCIDERRYDQISRLTDRAKLLVDFQDKIDSLESEWDTLGDDPKEKTRWQKPQPVSPSSFHAGASKRLRCISKLNSPTVTVNVFSADRQNALVWAISKDTREPSHNTGLVSSISR
jgi:type II secretory pathway pseudopilin PulG